MAADRDFPPPKETQETDGVRRRQRAHSPSSNAPGDPRNVPGELGACAVENGDEDPLNPKLALCPVVPFGF